MFKVNSKNTRTTLITRSTYNYFTVSFKFETMKLYSPFHDYKEFMKFSSSFIVSVKFDFFLPLQTNFNFIKLIFCFT